MAYNPSLVISDHFMDCMGNSHIKSGGGHRHEVFSSDEKKLVREELSKLNIFSEDTSRDRVSFRVSVRRVWKDLCDEEIDRFIERNCAKYSYYKN